MSTPLNFTPHRRGAQPRRKFDRRRLPRPIEVLRMLDAEPTRLSGLWFDVCCPVHNESRPSLRVHAADGHFMCHACGAKGGDILALYMQATGKPFVEAVSDLDAWEVQ